MAKPRHLDKAPVIEALIDLRVKIPKGFNVEELLSLKQELPDYPKVQKRQIVTSEVKIEDGKPTPTTKYELHGYLFKTSDEKNVAQFRIDGFTFSRLKPYTQWEMIVPEAKRLWNLFIAKVSPTSITRIAVRYINRLNIIEPISNFSEYLESPPKVPADLPKNIQSFLSRVVIYDSEKNITVNFIQAFEKNELNLDTIILDIDVFQQKEFDIMEREGIWPIFEQLHNMKNKVFFNSITEKTLELCL